jgi:hypothetical protein
MILAAAVVAAAALQRETRTIPIVMLGGVSAFTQALADLGWTVGRNVQMDLRWGVGLQADQLLRERSYAIGVTGAATQRLKRSSRPLGASRGAGFSSVRKYSRSRIARRSAGHLFTPIIGAITFLRLF